MSKKGNSNQSGKKGLERCRELESNLGDAHIRSKEGLDTILIPDLTGGEKLISLTKTSNLNLI